MDDDKLVLHGRRRNATALGSKGTGSARLPRQPEFLLALKPGTLPGDIDTNELHKAVENEYFTKYLERIGAAPTKANIDYVRRHAPLSKENVKAKLKVKGNMTDEVALIAPEPQVDLTALLPQKVPHKAMLVVGMVNNVADVPEAEDTEFSMAWGSNLKTSGVRDVVADRGQEPHFGDITQKFLFPFNLRIEGMRQIRDLAKEKLARQAAEESKRKQRSARRGSEAPGSRGQTGDPQRPPVQEDSEAPQPLQDERSGRLISEEDLEAEMEGEFEVTPEVVLALQSDFENSLLEWRKGVSQKMLGRVTEADFQATIDALSSDLVLHLFGTVAAYMYDEYVRCAARGKWDDETLSEARELEDVQRERVFTMHRQFASITKHYRSSRSRLFFTMPILILSMRTCIECLFREVFPLWTSIPEGVRATRLMQDSITELFDPHGYYSNLSILQSAPAAVRIMDGYKRLAHKQLRHHFSDTSPLVKAAYNDSKSSNTRKILHQQQQQPERLQSKAACKPELEPQQKYTLSELAQSISKKGKDLRQVGSNASYNRAGWMEEAAPSTVYY